MGEAYSPKGGKQRVKSGTSCQAYTSKIPYDVSGWYAGGNLFFGGLIGYLIVDPMTGAMWTLKDLHVNLESGLPVSSLSGGSVAPKKILQVISP